MTTAVELAIHLDIGDQHWKFPGTDPSDALMHFGHVLCSLQPNKPYPCRAKVRVNGYEADIKLSGKVDLHEKLLPCAKKLLGNH